MANGNTTQKFIVAGTTMAVLTPALQYAHTGGVGVICGLFSGVIAWNMVKDTVPVEEPTTPQPRKAVRNSLAYKMLVGKSMRGGDPGQADQVDQQEDGQGDDFERLNVQAGTFVFSDLLATGWRPSPESIFLARLEDGTDHCVPLKKITHIALAGSTRQGKTSIIRQLLVQFCSIGATCFLLDPHYTPYDIETDEDWTPFTPKLRLDPMECTSYERVESILRHAATVLLEKRRVLRAQSQPVGKHTFFVIDEYPAVVAERPDVAQYVGKLLREGGKYRLHLVIASHDFQVKTIDPSSKTGGGIRDNFSTCLYAGGDSTTAKELLDVAIPRNIEAGLGKGPIYMRSETHKQASLALTPWCDNEAIYMLVGPSTYEPERTTDELDEEDLLDIEIEQEDDDVPFRDPGIADRGRRTPEELPEGQNEGTVSRDRGSRTPEGWTADDVNLALRVYRNNRNKDDTLKAVGKAQNAKNRQALTAILEEA